MQVTAIATQPQHKPSAAEPKRRITAKVRVAVEAMVWQGLNRAQAAEHAGLKDNSLYVALAKPDVRSFYLQQLDVLRTSEKARNLHALVEIRDQRDNQMARVNAVKALEQLEDPQHAGGARSAMTPGLVVVIEAPHVAHQPAIDAKPLVDLD